VKGKGNGVWRKYTKNTGETCKKLRCPIGNPFCWKGRVNGEETLTGQVATLLSLKKETVRGGTLSSEEEGVKEGSASA